MNKRPKAADMVDSPRFHRVDAYRHRVWRLAVLLTGDTAAAAALFSGIMRHRKRIERVEPQRLDRLILLRARERAEALRDPANVEPRFARVYRLPEQPLEAWVLRRVEQLDETVAARAMDCSKTALRLHLKAADEALAEAGAGDSDDPATALRRRIDALDPAPAVARWRAKRRKRRWWVLLLAIALLAALALAGWWAPALLTQGHGR